jgi:chromosome segregation ATPase
MTAAKAIALLPFLLGAQCSFLGQRPSPVGFNTHTSSLGGYLRDLVKEEQAARVELAAQRDDALAALASTAENKTELGKMKREVARLRRELNAKRARLSATAEELEHVHHTDKMATSEVTNLRKEIQRLHHKDNSTNKEVIQLNRELQHLKQEDNLTKQEANTLRKQLHEVDRKLEQREEKTSQTQALRKQLQEMSRKLEQRDFRYRLARLCHFCRAGMSGTVPRIQAPVPVYSALKNIFEDICF